MEILVCVKQVPDDYVEVHLDPATGTPAVSGIERVNNAFDTYAVELAVRFCEAHGGTVTVASIGPEDCQSNLKNLLAVGASKAILFSDAALEGADEAGVAAYLSQMMEKCQAEHGGPFDLILCGKESTDEINSQVGAMLGEKMGLPFVSSVIEVNPCDAGLQAKQETEDGYALYEVTTPAVFTVAKPGYDPRYPTIKSKMAARKAAIPTFSAAEGGITPQANHVTCLGYTEPPKRQAGVRIQEKEAAEAVNKALAMMADAKVL